MKLRARIKQTTIRPDIIQPIFVDFPIGKLKHKKAKNISSTIYHDQIQNKSVIILSNRRIIYKGYKPNIKEAPQRSLLALYHKQSSKVKLLEAERWQVAPAVEKLVIEENKNDINEKIVMLNKQFGSKKVKRRTEQFEKMKVNVDAIKEQLEKTVSNVEIDRLDLSTQLPTDEFDALLPACNRNASNVKDVYNVYDIIPKSKLETLYEHAMEVLDGDTEKKSKFFKLTLKNLQSDPDKVNKVAFLLYIEMINAWFVMPLRDAKKRDVVVCPVSEEVNQHIINTYSMSTGRGRSRPNYMKDKGIIHCLILALMISNFALNLELFETMLGMRISFKKLTDLARIIGATSSKQDKKYITLRVPLPAPVSLVKRGKKRTHSK